jgi:hypothetical protein
MKGTLHLVTFSHHVSPELEDLETAAREGNMAFSVLGLDRDWHRNAIKLKLLYNFLKRSPKEEYILVSDAFDVKILGKAEEIIEKFEALHSEIVFSAESNFYFRNEKRSYYNWTFYPTPPTQYQSLTS